VEKQWLVGIIVGIIFGVFLLVVGRWLLYRRKSRIQPPVPLEPGWQLYTHPTSGEPPGTIFRIDDKGRRFIVADLNVGKEHVEEEYGQYKDTFSAGMGLAARFLGIGTHKLTAQGMRSTSLTFELQDVVREYVVDDVLNRALAAWTPSAKCEEKSNYYVIRESRSSTHITFLLREDEVQDLGGESSIVAAATVDGTLHVSHAINTFQLDKRFDGHRRVMFLPYEIPPWTGVIHEAVAASATSKPIDRRLEWEVEGRSRGDTRADFLVDELVAPLARRLGGPWVRAVAPDVDTELRELLIDLVAAQENTDADTQWRATETAQAQLVRYGQQAEGLACLEQVATLVKVSSKPRSDPEAGRLEQFMALLTFVFDRVARMGHPVALPGFFNSEDCVTVIDVRSDDAELTLPYLFESDRRPTIWFTTAASDALKARIPRVWLIRPEANQRDRLVEECNEKFDRPRAHQPHASTLYLELGESAKFVSSITSDLVSIGGPTFRPSSSDLTLEEGVREQIAFIDENPIDRDPYYAIDSNAGITLLLAHLESQLNRQWKRDRQW
jgi:hypothetical protein